MMRAGVLEAGCVPVADVGSREKSNDGHARRYAGFDPTHTVLNDNAHSGVDAHLPGRMQKNIRMRFAAWDLGCTVDMRTKKLRQVQNFKAEREAVRRRRRGDATWNVQESFDVGASAVDDAEVLTKSGQRAVLKVMLEIIR